MTKIVNEKPGAKCGAEGGAEGAVLRSRDKRHTTFKAGRLRHCEGLN